jgi:hypothetical protein
MKSCKRVQETTKFNPDMSSRNSRRAPTKSTRKPFQKRRHSTGKLESVVSSWLDISGIKRSEWDKEKDEGQIGRCRIQTTAMICAVEYVMGRGDEAMRPMRSDHERDCFIRKHYSRATFSLSVSE